jgi:DNA-binding NarL/FixJ family response regulator
VFANALGAKLFDRDPDGMTLNLKRRISAPAVDVREIRAPGHRPHWLVVLEPSNDVSHSPDRLAKATELWKLTRRQIDVLRLAMTGDANKIIADKLSCAEVTIEFHMTALFRKAGVESRAQLVSRFWTL